MGLEFVTEYLAQRWTGLLPLLLITALFVVQLQSKKENKKEVKIKNEKKDAPTEIKAHAVSPDFKWNAEQPAKSYPFKDKEYKLNMGIQTFTPNEWLLIEDTYLDRIEEKTKLVTNTHPKYPKDKNMTESTMFSTPIAKPAIRELYDVVIQYMCDKYPMYFKVSEDGSTVHNGITKEDVPATSGDIDVTKLMYYLVRTIEEDFIIMMPDPSLDDPEFGNEYYFKGGVFAFANGFDPKNKINQPMTNIHGPIPGYQEKLKLSMNRYFTKLPPCKIVGRANFAIQAHDKFYVDNDNKGYYLTEEQVRTPIPFEDLDFDKGVFYRSERQMLTRLPKTGAIIFTIRTYLHPFSDFKKQPVEVAKRLLGSIQKFPDDMAVYKGFTRLGPAVTRYLDEL